MLSQNLIDNEPDISIPNITACNKKNIYINCLLSIGALLFIFFIVLFIMYIMNFIQ